MVPVAADAVQARERRFTQQRVSRQTLERDGHAHSKITANHHPAPKGPRIRTPLQFIRWVTTEQKDKRKPMSITVDIDNYKY